MPQILYIVYWVLRLGPIGLGIMASLILGLGLYLQVLQNEGHADDAAALLAGPPAAVDVANFDPDLHATEQGEVVLRGQAVYDFAYELRLEKDTGDDDAFMVPLVSSTSFDDTEIVGIAFFYETGFDFDRLTPEFLMNGVVDFGDVGPIMEYNGSISGLGRWSDLTEDAFFEKGLKFSDDLVVIWPYLHGREDKFAPPKADETSMFGLFSKIAGGLVLLALAKLVFASKPDDTPTVQGPTAADTPLAAAFEPIPPANAADAMPLWKQRAEGKFETLFGEFETPSSATPDGDTPSAPRFDAAPAKAMTRAETLTQRQSNIQPPLITPKRSGLGVRKVLIGIVAGLFVLGLVSTVSDLIAKSTASDLATITTPQDIAAATVADLVVPDADPNRHWTDIDVTPVIEWFVAKSILAVSGDVEAMTTLGMIVGGLLVTLFMLRVYITARLASTLGRRRSYSFDDLTTGG